MYPGSMATTVVQPSYPVISQFTVAPPSYIHAFTSDPDAAPFGTKADTANAYMDYMKSSKMKATFGSTAPVVQYVPVSIAPANIAVPKPVQLPAGLGTSVDLYTDGGPNDEASMHITGTISGVSPTSSNALA